jgi:hypothetical protein
MRQTFSRVSSPCALVSALCFCPVPCPQPIRTKKDHKQTKVDQNIVRRELTQVVEAKN